MEEELELLNSKYKESRFIEEQIESIDQQISELRAVNESIKEIQPGKSKEIMTQLGKGIFVRSEIKEDKLFINVGTGIIIRRGSEEIRNTVENQILKLGEIRYQFNERLSSLAAELEKMVSKLRENR